MPNLVAVDVSVTDDRISLVFSHRAVAAAYAAYLKSEDARPLVTQSTPGYRRSPHFNAAGKEVTLTLPNFITWFITCRLPDDEDSVTFTYGDMDEDYADRWAESMILFERVPGPVYDDDSSKQMHVRRLRNKAVLLKRLEDYRRAPRAGINTPYPRAGPAPLMYPAVPTTQAMSSGGGPRDHWHGW